MSKTEFASVMAYLAAGCGKPASLEQTRVYFDLLGDLPLTAVQEGARRALLEHKFPTLPPVGLIRSHAVSLGNERMTGAEAWQLILAAIRRYGLAHQARGMISLPPEVAHAATVFGWRLICETRDDELGIRQTAFLKVWDALAKQDDRKCLMPPPNAANAILTQGIGIPSTDEKTIPRLTQ